MRKQFFLTLLICFPILLFSQTVIVEGYVFESGNRGYLGQATVTVLDHVTKAVKGEVFTDKKGVFQMGLIAGNEYLIRIEKKPFETMEKIVSTKGKTEGDKVYVKYEMKRLPGYSFEVTLAPTRSDEDEVVDAITGARIEVYNNTTKKEELVIDSSASHVFNARFEQGNHYTILIRKDKFFNKRLEAYVNVKGCILCFDGVGDVRPGVSDVLTEGFEMGTLLANVELQPIELNKAIAIENIYYDYNSARLKTAAREELDKLVAVLNDNRSLLVEIGSHTDSRGEDKYNQKLSHRRAKSVVEYLANKGIAKTSMLARGYGESKLVNKCKNGVDCTDEQHQKNRRTELKVVGFVNENLKDNRSLAEIKEEEQFEQMLAELAGSEIKVSEGEELPDEIARQLEQKEENQKPENKPKTEEKQDRPSPPKQNKPVQKPSVQQTEKPVAEPEVIKEEATQAIDNEETIIVHKPMPERTQEIEVVEEIEEVIDEEEEAPAFVEIPVEESEVEEFEMTQASNFVQKELEVSSARELKKPQKLGINYTGFRVEFMTAMSELPISHTIFSRHGNIVFEENKDGGYAYLLGDFAKEKDAEDFLNNILIKRYPGARVIQYSQGRRIAR